MEDVMLDQEHALVKKAAADFAQRRIAPEAAGWAEQKAVPRTVLRAMADLGYLGIMVPLEAGGAGMGALAFALVLEEIARGDGACSTIVEAHNSGVVMPLYASGTKEQRERYLAPLLSGEMLGAFCLTEPDAGSDASALKTRARREGEKYVLTGVKQFVTNGATADLAVVFAVTDPDAGKRGISAFLVRTDQPGYRVLRREVKMGQAASDTCQIAFDGVELDAGCRLGSEGEGYRIALANLEAGRVGIAAQAIGMAQSAFDRALRYAHERIAFGVPIIKHQAVAFRLAKMAADIEAARQLTYHAASLKDAGQPCIKETSMAKLIASEMAEQVCSEAIQTFGGAGYIADSEVERIYRDARVTKIYEGTSDIQKLVIARALSAEAR
jgi:butyryl-CoA dehydrogenase